MDVLNFTKTFSAKNHSVQSHLEAVGHLPKILKELIAAAVLVFGFERAQELVVDGAEAESESS